MELRWYVRERDVTNWDDRKDEYITMTNSDAPVLQYRTGPFADWINVPTVREKAT